MSIRGGRFYHRRRLPSDVQRLTGKVEIWRSLQTDSLKVALRRLPSIAARVEVEIEHVRLSSGLAVDAALIGPLPDDQVERRETTQPASILNIRTDISLTLAEAYQRYIDDPTRSWSPSTREAYETCRKLSIAVIGGEVSIASIGRAHCRDLLDVLRFLPRNASKRFPGCRRARRRTTLDSEATSRPSARRTRTRSCQT